MKNSTNFLPFPQALLLAVFLMLANGAARAAEGYAIEVKVTPTEGEATSTSTGGLALRDNYEVVLPIQLSHTDTPATVEFDFDLSMGAVDITVADLKVVSARDGSSLVEREYFDGRIFLVWNQETTLYASATETVTFTVTAPVDQAGSLEPTLSAEELKKIEAKFRTSEDRIYAEIYNPTEYEISEYRVRVVADPAGEFKGLDRVYQWRGSVKPFSEERTQIEAQLPGLREGVEYRMTLIGAARR